MAKALLISSVAVFLVSLALAISAGFARGGAVRVESTEPGRQGRVRSFGGRSVAYAWGFISMKHLRSGSATHAEWTQVIATTTALCAFAMIFVSAGWLLAGSSPFVAFVIALVPILWLSQAIRAMWADWCAAKPKQAGTRTRP